MGGGTRSVGERQTTRRLHVVQGAGRKDGGGTHQVTVLETGKDDDQEVRSGEPRRLSTVSELSSLPQPYRSTFK